MKKSTIYDISETIIFGESMGISKPINYQQMNHSVKLLEKYKQCIQKYKEYQYCKYLLDVDN